MLFTVSKNSINCVGVCWFPIVFQCPTVLIVKGKYRGLSINKKKPKIKNLK